MIESLLDAGAVRRFGEKIMIHARLDLGSGRVITTAAAGKLRSTTPRAASSSANSIRLDEARPTKLLTRLSPASNIGTYIRNTLPEIHALTSYQGDRSCATG